MNFENGHTYVMPDMITHYVRNHHYKPPEDFVDDVLNSSFEGGDRAQTFSSYRQAEKVGYLSGEFPIGDLEREFLPKLESLMEQAASGGQRIQTNTADPKTSE